MIDNGFDNILATPNGKVHRLLTKLAFLNIGHPFQLIIGQKVVGPKIALKKIPLIFMEKMLQNMGTELKTTTHLNGCRAITAFDVDNEESIYLV